MWTPGSSTNPVRTDSYGTFPTSTTVTASFAPNDQNVCQNGADDYPTCTPGKPPKDLTAQASPTASPLPVAKIIIPKLTKTTTKYNRQRQGISYTVEPSTATCKVTYNGSSALPTNAGTYNIVIKCKDGRVTGGTTGTFVIEKGQPQLTWDNPNPITTTDALTRSELKAKSDVVGTLEYAPALGTKMPAGTHNLKVTLTPRDTKNYLSAATNVKLLVTEKAVVIVKPKKFAAIKIPFTLSSAGLTKKTRPMISNIFMKNKVTSVTVYGYVQPTKDKSNDMTLSKSRAQTVAKQLKKLNPKLKITIKAMGATINPACKAEKNKCVIVS
jgi:outer membrane protein OmpA-like peptidoglycan-associated protein